MKLVTYLGNENIYVRFINHSDIENDPAIHRNDLTQMTSIGDAFDYNADQIEIYNIPKREFTKDDVYIDISKYLVETTLINFAIIEELVEFHMVEADFRNGILLKWAYINEYLSVVIYLMTKYKEKIKPLIQHILLSAVVEKTTPSISILEYLINKCGFSIHQEDELLLRRCLTSKKYSTARFLLESGAKIPYGLYMGFYNNRKHAKFKPGYELLKEYKHQLEVQ